MAPAPIGIRLDASQADSQGRGSDDALMQLVAVSVRWPVIFL
jgi:hypothetical protein